ncbi:MAG: hypothetical protein IID44_21400 [Planctomycetes bacterium]|nr:hypothetical protein [Planctomycetota bacterium]
MNGHGKTAMVRNGELLTREVVLFDEGGDCCRTGDAEGGRLNKWDEAERAELLAELDAAFFHLYGIDRDNAEYILSTFKKIHDQRTLLPGHPSTAQFILP